MHLFIVARQHRDLYDYLSERLSGNGAVCVIADRRSGERRRRAAPAAAERRRAERRARPEIEEQLRVHSHAIVTVKAEAPPAETRVLRDTLEWVDTVQHHVTAVRAVLYDHERLRRETETVKEDNARLGPENERLRVESERLRAEAAQARQELEHVDAQLGRAIAIVNDLLARMQRGPAPADAGG